MAVAAPGGWELFGRDPVEHQMFADHCVAENPIEVSAKGRIVQEWRSKVGRPENHWWDCLIGAAAAASMLGASIPGVEIRPARRRPEDRPTAAQLAKIR